VQACRKARRRQAQNLKVTGWMAKRRAVGTAKSSSRSPGFFIERIQDNTNGQGSEQPTKKREDQEQGENSSARKKVGVVCR